MKYIFYIFFIFYINYIYTLSFNKIISHNYINYTLQEITYKNKYFYYFNKYKYLINITETNLFPNIDGNFVYYFQPFCIPHHIHITSNINNTINRTITYKIKYITLLHELIHYFQCIYSKKKYIYYKIKSITHFKPSNIYRKFIKKYYNKSKWNIEFESYYITQYPYKFKFFENKFKNFQNNIFN